MKKISTEFVSVSAFVLGKRPSTAYLTALTLVTLCIFPALVGAVAPLSVRSVTTTPAQVKPYQPFEITVEYSQSYCIARTTPIISQGSVTAGASKLISVTLSHLDVATVPCTMRSTSTVRMPGVAPGTWTLRMALTQTTTPSAFNYRSATVESGDATVVVPDVESAPAKLMTINGFNNGPFYLSSIDALDPYGTGSLLPSAGGTASTPSFYGWASQRSDAVPTVATRLYSLKFANPVRYYYTALVKERDGLTKSGFTEEAPAGWVPIYVLPAVGGACPLGSKPVRRLFNAADMLHRYEMNMDTAAMLAANGYVDENIAFCSPMVEQ